MLSSLDDLVSQIESDVTAEQYVNNKEDLPTFLTFDGEDCVNLRQSLHFVVVEGSLPKRLELDAEEDESSDVEDLECSSIQ